MNAGVTVQPPVAAAVSALQDAFGQGPGAVSADARSPAGESGLLVGAARSCNIKHGVVAIMSPGGTERGGGIGRWVGYLQAEWLRAGLTPPIRLIDTRGFGGLAVGAWHFARSLGALARLMAAGRLLAVHANLAVGGSTVRKLILSRICFWSGTPLILQLHSGHYFEFYHRLPAWAQRQVRGMFRRADRVIALGHGWAQRIADTFGIPVGSIVVMPNSVLAPSPRPPRPQNDVPHIVFLGRIADHKGLAELIEALGSPAVAAVPWRATLAGDGDAAPYAAAAARAGIAARLCFPGWLEGAAVAATLAEADLVVLPSYYESLPVSIVEAMANGVATVATPVGGLPELLTDGESVCFVPVGDSRALAEVLERLLTDIALRARIAAGGYQVFRDRLMIEDQAMRLQELYREVLAARARA